MLALGAVIAFPPEAKSIHWYCLPSTADSYNVSAEQFGFAGGASRWIYREPAPLSGESVLQGPSLLGAFDSKTGYGVADLFAQIETTSGVFVSKTVRLISVADDVPPFQQTLSSEFNLPYIFFGSSLARLGASGPEVGLGADCANFIIFGLRGCGWQIPWSDAKHLIPRPIFWRESIWTNPLRTLSNWSGFNQMTLIAVLSLFLITMWPRFGVQTVRAGSD